MSPGPERQPPESLDPELALVRRALAGERAAFDALYDSHFPRVFHLARTRLDESAARSATEATFETLMGLLPAYRGQRPLATWIATLARHEIRLRSDVRRPPSAFDRRAAASPVP